MKAKVDFSRKDTYQGDSIEETFKPFTQTHIPFWWHFREVLHASDRRASWLKKSDEAPSSDEEQRKFIALSLLNHYVYISIFDAKGFFNQMEFELFRSGLTPIKAEIEVLRVWRALYSSLYRSFNALCNILCVVVCGKSPFGETEGEIWNYTPRKTKGYIDKLGIGEIASPLNRCIKRLEIRHQIDHYWIIWHALGQGVFQLAEFEKGDIILDPGPNQLSLNINARSLAYEDIYELAKDFNLIYEKLAVKGGFLDQYFLKERLMIDYSDYKGWGGKRPFLINE